MSPELDRLLQQYATVLDSRSAAACQAHPAGDADRWSAQEIAGHLALTYRSSAQTVQRRIDKGEPPSARKSVRQHAMQAMVIGLGVFPKRQRAPEFARPQVLAWEPKSGAELIAELAAGLKRMDAALDAAEARFARVPVASHFILGPLTAAEWRRFHCVHGGLHLRQMRKCFQG